MRQEGDLKFLYKLKVDESALKKRNINPRPTEYRKETMLAAQIASGQALKFQQSTKPDTSAKKKQNDFFESEFDKDTTGRNDKISSSSALSGTGRSLSQNLHEEEPVLKKAKLFDYKLKFSVDNFTAGFNNDVLITKYQPFTGSLPINMSGADAFSGMFKASVFD
ncbi:MAG: hypothetical protein ABUT20_59105 [Bacteroidota bacterium]